LLELLLLLLLHGAKKGGLREGQGNSVALGLKSQRCRH